MTRRIVLVFGVCAIGVGAHAQASNSEPAQLPRVEVTGSSLKRIDAETALPVQVITREQILKSGAANAEQLLQTVSAMASAGGQVSASVVGSTTAGISAISLHGLSSSRTLVLINGRRVSPYGIGFGSDSVSVDVNSIPLAAIERVEVLKDGASAVYGSDAIAGVVNFILRKNFKGTQVTGEYGDSTQHGGGVARGSATIGFGDLGEDKYNIMLVASLQRERALMGGQRGFAASNINVGHLNDNSSGNTFPANIAAADGSFGAYNPSRPSGCLLPYSQVDPLLSTANACRYDPAAAVTLIPQTDRISLLGTGRLVVNSNLELFAEASFNQNKITTTLQPVPLSDQFALPAQNALYNVDPYFGAATILLKSSNPFYPTAYVTGITGGATPDLLVRYRAVTAGTRSFTDTSTAPRLVLGARGAVGGWDFETAALHSSSEVRERTNTGYPIYSQILPILNSGTVNFFGPNTDAINSQLGATMYAGDAFRARTSIDGISGKLSRDLAQLAAGPMALAVGGEIRRESYSFDAATALQQGDVAGYGGNFLPIDRQRKVAAVFGELSVPIVQSLEADFAVRYDKYQGVGDATTPKVSLRFQPNSTILFRGSIGRGFRAPSLAELYAPNTQSVSSPGLSDPARCFDPSSLPAGSTWSNDTNKDCQTQFTTLNGGNPNLKPERSTNATLGFVLQPTNDVTIGLDYFKVRLKDTISTGLDAGTILSDPTRYSGLIQRGSSDGRVDPITGAPLPGSITGLVQTNLNMGGTKVSGLELDVRWAVPAGDLGRFTVGLNGTYMIQFDTQNLDGSYSGAVAQVNSSTGGVVPRWKHYLVVDWQRGPWGASIAQNFQLGYHDTAGNLDDDTATHRARNYVTYDAQVTYSGFKNWKLTLGARNLFDADPPYVNTNAAFQAGYDPQYADPRGRFIYGRVTYAF